jgi:hypothetical protein
MRPTLELLGELAEQTRSLVQIELALVGAELRERGALISSSATKAGVGLIFLPIGLALIFVALSLALRRFGIPADLAFLIVALLAIAGGSLALISGLTGLKPVRLIPSRSISRISSLLGEFQDSADVRSLRSPGEPMAVANGSDGRRAALESHALEAGVGSRITRRSDRALLRGAVDFASTRHPGSTAILDLASHCGSWHRLASATKRASTR